MSGTLTIMIEIEADSIGEAIGCAVHKLHAVSENLQSPTVAASLGVALATEKSMAAHGIAFDWSAAKQ